MSDTTNVVAWRARRYACVTGLTVVALAVAALVGWLLEIEIVKSGLPGKATIKPLTAVGFALLGVAIACCARAVRFDVRRPLFVWAARLAALIALAIASTTLVE